MKNQGRAVLWRHELQIEAGQFSGPLMERSPSRPAPPSQVRVGDGTWVTAMLDGQADGQAQVGARKALPRALA